jgi:uncharacterized membrane protein
MPFCTALMGEFIRLRLALLVYWLNILALGLLLRLAWRHAVRHELLDEGVSDALRASVDRRIVIAQCLYPVGALLCVINNFWSLGFIVLVQLNYAIAPRWGVLGRI